MTYSRYAIYHTPHPGSPLHVFGGRLLGWNSAAGGPVEQMDLPGIDVAALTKTPRKYGFHATIKPPFRLAKGQDADALLNALDALAATAAPVILDSLALAGIGRFLALVPVGDVSALAALAARVVQELDPFRAPLTEAELARRRASRLSPPQEEYLTRWGYPYVLDEFRYHMTLSGRLDDPALVLEALRPHVDALPLAPYQLDSLSLLGEGEGGRFHELHRVTLRG